MTFEDYPDREMLFMGLANTLAGALRRALDQRARVLFAVPGGTTPGPVFDALCAVDLDWGRVDVMLTDERWVPEDHPRSNTRLLRERLLVERAAAARLLPMYLPGETPEARIEEMRATVAEALPISVLLLGMGADGHTASLFPGADNLAAALEADAPPLMAMRAPDSPLAPEPRVTLTAPPLADALSKHLVITGDEKRAVLEAARRTPALEAPVRAVLSECTVHWSQ
jgi:6-phosphogluconolactonase